MLVAEDEACIMEEREQAGRWRCVDKINLYCTYLTITATIIHWSVK